MAALELVRDRESREPAGPEAARVLALCRERGLLVLKAGVHANVIRMLAPLSTPDGLLEEGLSILEGALTAVSEETFGRDRNRAVPTDSAPTEVIL
jgi:4-aminobutyrate aminotransferase/(S)-3-amino-2-methylpropionate transaminase